MHNANYYGDGMHLLNVENINNSQKLATKTLNVRQSKPGNSDCNLLHVLVGIQTLPFHYEI